MAFTWTSARDQLLKFAMALFDIREVLVSRRLNAPKAESQSESGGEQSQTAIYQQRLVEITRYPMHFMRAPTRWTQKAHADRRERITEGLFAVRSVDPTMIVFTQKEEHWSLFLKVSRRCLSDTLTAGTSRSSSSLFDMVSPCISDILNDRNEPLVFEHRRGTKT